MKLTLRIDCATYAIARKLHVDLGQHGFDAGVVSPSNGYFCVEVVARPQHVNYGPDIYLEIKAAHVAALDFFAGLEADAVSLEITAGDAA